MDEAAVVEGNPVTSRRPDDILAISRGMIALFGRRPVATVSRGPRLPSAGHGKW
ncbi:MAG: hypothetical protein JWO38_6589 [Gemmataceae bacterium]|nr:hypothetical protein [Gemmataceae bacterium]